MCVCGGGGGGGGRGEEENKQINKRRNGNLDSWFRSYVRVEVAVLGCPS